MSKPVILVDQDGPLGAFDAHFWSRCGDEGIDLDCALTEQRHRFATDHVADRAQRDRARSMVNQTGWFADLPVVEGAVEGLAALDEVADVWICSKPLDANPTCRDEKAQWLARHFGEKWAARLILAPNKSMINAHILLDDAPKLGWLPRAPWMPVIFRMPWNQEGSDWERLPHWDWSESIDTLINYVWRTTA